MSPEGGEVTVTDIHPGGQAHFHCDPGFQIRGHEVATCVNATQPRWSVPEPHCVGLYKEIDSQKNRLFSNNEEVKVESDKMFFFFSCVLWWMDS